MADKYTFRSPQTLLSEPGRTFGLLGMVGRSPQMKEIFELVQKVAPTDATVLIAGETGVGKECLARALHLLSKRRDQGFLALNCTAIPESLLESQLFGYVKGAFTGASDPHAGLFREANGGTILLDEIGELPWNVQAKLLRVLEAKEVMPLGSSKSLKVDVRIIAATNRDLVERVAIRRFRDDLYYRLSTVPISVPPLRERLQDLPDLVQFLVRRRNGIAQSSYDRVTQEALEELSSRVWKGNVRELDNVLERAMIIGDGKVIQVKDLQDTSRREPAFVSGNLKQAVRAFEKQHIENMLRQVNGNRECCAEALGISRSSLFQKLATLGLSEKSPRTPNRHKVS